MSDDTDLKVSVARIEVTTAETNRRLDRIERLMETVSAHGARLDTHDIKISNIDTRVTTLEKGKDWVIKSVVGVVIAAVLGLVVLKTGIPFPIR